jgi:hypothetical protein
MCSLSFLIFPDRTVLTMNRDEARDRAEEPELFGPVGAARAVHPKDVRAGGSWFGANQFGLAMALLNRYQDPHDCQRPISRGVLIPALLQARSVSAIRGILDEGSQFDLSRLHPFDLAICSKDEVLLLSWNGREKSWQRFGESIFLSSSAVRTEEVIAHRQQIFKGWLQQSGLTSSKAARTVLCDLHLAQAPDPMVAIRMARPHSHTKSVCQYVLDTTSTLRYWPEAAVQNFDASQPDARTQHFAWTYDNSARDAAAASAPHAATPQSV